MPLSSSIHGMINAQDRDPVATVHHWSVAPISGNRMMQMHVLLCSLLLKYVYQEERDYCTHYLLSRRAQSTGHRL